MIAGHPWFLDWGRDSLIAARGLLAAGRLQEVRQLVHTFAQFEESGTLPNSIHGQDASNRETSDAPLWLGVVIEDLAKACQGAGQPTNVHSELVGTSPGRSLKGVLESIATHYIQGTPHRVHMDPASGLIWSPSHFTWMDTNYPAGTPREGYPIEIQALWIRLLRQFAAIGEDGAKDWRALAEKAVRSVEKKFWIEELGWYSDRLAAERGVAAADARQDDALRSNCVFLISLGIATGERARRTVQAVIRHLLVPGAMRSLAPLPVKHPLPIRNHLGHLINDPHRPYWGRYEGDEDSRRKPADHNGTAWCWTFPALCEAIAFAWPGNQEAKRAAGSYLSSIQLLLNKGCLGQLPEILDGNAPYTERGCDAQAWSVTEALRVLELML